jgi:hypothetical protein
MRVELLYWDGCPSHPQALSDLRAAMDELGLDPDAVEVRHIDTDDAAAADGFVGSPTIRIDGADIADPGEEAVGLTCRIYYLRDGRVSAVPDPEDVRDALRRALNEQEPA